MQHQMVGAGPSSPSFFLSFFLASFWKVKVLPCAPAVESAVVDAVAAHNRTEQEMMTADDDDDHAVAATYLLTHLLTYLLLPCIWSIIIIHVYLHHPKEGMMIAVTV